VIVPLEVMIGSERHREGLDLAPAALADALAHGVRVTTSQPGPVAFADAYERAAATGAAEIVSIHLSAELSGTVQAAQRAARSAAVPVHVVDSRSVVMGLGFAAVSAARYARGDSAPDPACGGEDAQVMPDGGRGPGRSRVRALLTRLAAGGVSTPGGLLPDGAAVAERAQVVAASARAWFLVDSLDHLRRGGRLSATAAALGTVLGLRPILGLRGGRIEVVEKVRTRRAARDRLEAIVVADVRRRGRSRVAVHHLGQPELAAQLAQQLEAWLGDLTVPVEVCEVSAVIAAHVGPGLLAIVVADP